MTAFCNWHGPLGRKGLGGQGGGRRLAAWWVVLLGLLPLAGCGSRPGPPPEVESNIKALSILYGRYLSTHRGASPAGPEEFKKFIGAVDKGQLESLRVDPANLDKLFTSPRDNQPYVLAYKTKVGVPSPMGAPVVAYEQTGSNGRRYVAYATGQVEEVDEAKFRQLVADKK